MKIISLIFLVCLFTSCQQAERETYLIPSDFTGRVEIVFNQNGAPVKYQNEYGRDTIYTPKMGAPIKYEDGRRLYEVPENGILLTQFRDNDGFIHRKYFTVDRNGKRTPLEVYELDNSKNDSAEWIVKNKTKKGIFLDGTSGSIGNMNIPFQEFLVSSYKMLDSITAQSNEKIFERNLGKMIGINL